MTKREQQILELIQADPLLSQQAIAKALGISRSAVAGHIMRLATKGAIKGRGYIFGSTPFVAVIGGANVDILGSPIADLRMHDSNPGRVSMSAGGVARNVAENLARLGIDCRLVTAIGDDEHGALLLRQGRDAGIDMRYVMKSASAPTSTYLSILDDSGDMHVAISDMTIMAALGPGYLLTLEKMLKQAALIVVDMNISDHALAWLTDTIADGVFFVDTVSTTKAVRIKPYLNAVHTLTPGLAEAEAIAGIKANSIRQLPKLADWFHTKGVQRLFVTLGNKGVFYSTGDEQGISKPSNGSSQIKNAGGAGDAFLSGLAYSWISSWPLAKSVQFGLAAAGVTMSHEKTNNPKLSLKAVNRAIADRHAD